MPRSGARWTEALRRAHELLDSMLLLDGHNDLPLVIRRDPVAMGDVRVFKLLERRASGDTDIPRLREGRVSAQVWAAFVPSESAHPARDTLEQIDLVLRMHDAHPDVFHPVTRSNEIQDAKSRDRIASILAVEGAIGLENSLAALRFWYDAGVRLMTLCHNSSLDWVDSATDVPRCGGLSDFGHRVIRELNRLGVIVDCSHASDAAVSQVLEVSTAPVVLSHSNARHLCDHVRNASDDILAQLAARDGLVMATFLPNFVSEEVRRWMIPVRQRVGKSLGSDWPKVLRAYEAEHGPAPLATVEQVADHIEYLASRVGHERVGIGSDFYGGPSAPAGLEDVSCFPSLLAAMLLRGWSEEKLAALAGLNFVRVFAAVEREAERMRLTQ